MKCGLFRPAFIRTVQIFKGRHGSEIQTLVAIVLYPSLHCAQAAHLSDITDAECALGGSPAAEFFCLQPCISHASVFFLHSFPTIVYSAQIFWASQQFCGPSGTSAWRNHIYILSDLTMGQLDISSWVAIQQTNKCVTVKCALGARRVHFCVLPFNISQLVRSVVVTAKKAYEKPFYFTHAVLRKPTFESLCMYIFVASVWCCAVKERWKWNRNLFWRISILLAVATMWLPWEETTHSRAITAQIILLLKRMDEKRNKWWETWRRGRQKHK